MPHVDGQWELGAAAYEKRGVAVSVPTWDETKCIQCNNCAYVCPHATIRPFALTEEEAKAKAEPNTVFGGRLGTYKYYDMHNVIDTALTAYEEQVEPLLKK